MLIDQRYKEVKAGIITEYDFLHEASQDDRISKFITGFHTFDQVVELLKAKSMLFEDVEEAPLKRFDFASVIKEALTPVQSEHVHPYEFEKGWRYEIKLTGKFEDEDVQKAKAKAVKNLEKDPIHYTKLEMGEHAPDEKGHKMLDVSKGQNFTDPDNQSKPVKSTPIADTESQKYADDMYEKGKAPKVIDLKKKSSLSEGSALDDLTRSHENDKNPLVSEGDDPRFDKFTLQVDKPTYKGVIKRDQKGWALYNESGEEEGAHPFGTLQSLMSHYDISKDQLSGEYTKNLKEEDCGNKLPGGKGDSLSAADVDQEELSLGLSIEGEHTEDPEIAKEIALDHLAEDPKYYSKMKASGLEEAVRSVPAETQYPFYVIQYGNKFVAGFDIDADARHWATNPENRSKQLSVVTAEEVAKMKGMKITDPKNWNDIGSNNFMWKTYNESLEQLKEALRPLVRAKLLEAVGNLPTPDGPDVWRKELKRQLQGVSWPAVGEKDPDNSYKAKIDQEKIDSIKSLVDKLDQEGIDLYNQAAPEGCKWGEENDLFSVKEDAEDATPQIHQELQDLLDLDPKDLAKMATEKKFPANSVKYKLALKALGAAIKDGNKDPEVRKAFQALADQFKGKSLNEEISVKPKAYEYTEGKLQQLKAKREQLLRFSQGDYYGVVFFLLDPEVKAAYAADKGRPTYDGRGGMKRGETGLKRIAKQYRQKDKDIIIDLRGMDVDKLDQELKA